MKELNILSIDIGAGSGRVILSSFNGVKITSKEVYRFNNNSIVLNGTIFWDFLNIIFEIKKGYLKVSDATGDNIDCIGVDTWGCDFGLLDKYGNLLSNPVSYRDKRGESVEQEIFSIIDREHLERLNSSLTYNFCTLFQLYHVYKYNKYFSSIVDSFLTMPNLINYYLTGVKVVDQSILSGSQFFDVKSRRYRKDILKLLNIPDKILPENNDSGIIIGNLQNSSLNYSGSSTTTKVAQVCSQDSPSAVIGIPLDKDDSESCYINSGTWSIVGIESREPIVNREAFQDGFTNWRTFRNNNMFLKIFNSFYFIQLCKKIWDLEDGVVSSYKNFYKNIRINSRTNALVNLESDFLMGKDKNFLEILSIYFKKTKQSADCSRKDYIISFLQSMVLEYKLIIDGLEKHVRKKFKKVFMVGGGSLNSIFCQWISDCLEKEIYTGYPESTINGNIIVQLYALGEINSLEQGRDIIRESHQEVIYSPKGFKKVYWQDLFGKYLEIKKII